MWIYMNVWQLDYTHSFPHLCDKLFTQLALGPKGLGLLGHVLFGLGVKCGVLDEAVHKHPQMISHLWKQEKAHIIHLTNKVKSSNTYCSKWKKKSKTRKGKQKKRLKIKYEHLYQNLYTKMKQILDAMLTEASNTLCQDRESTYLKRHNFDAFFVLLFNDLNEFCDALVRHIVHVSTTLHTYMKCYFTLFTNFCGKLIPCV